MTEADEPVPVFAADPVIFLIVFDVNVPGERLFNIPINCAVVDVELFWIEFATVPPMVFEFAVHATLDNVFALITYTIKAPVAPALFAVIPPKLLLLEVQTSELKL